MGVLEGIKVIDVGVLVQAPQAATMLGDMGADVLKVELPGFGDQSRWLPVGGGIPESPYFEACNRGKRSLTLDLRKPRGREVFLDLIRTTDVLISNFKPGTLDDWGLSYEVLSEVNPRLVHAAGSAFGERGPDAPREGADIAAQAAGGLISATGVDGGEPTPLAITICDHIASMNIVAGVLASLYHRTSSGRGQRVDVSLLGAQLWAQASEYTHYFLSGRVPGRPNQGHPLIAGVYGIFPTSDGHIAIVGVPTPTRAKFYELLGRAELADDPRLAGLLPMDVKLWLFGEISVGFRERTTAEWCALLGAEGIRYAPVRDYAAVAEDPQVWENEYLVKTLDAQGREVTRVGTPIRFSETPSRIGGPPPSLGQHTEEVLLELGLEWEQIAELAADNTI